MSAYAILVGICCGIIGAGLAEKLIASKEKDNEKILKDMGKEKFKVGKDFFG